MKPRPSRRWWHQRPIPEADHQLIVDDLSQWDHELYKSELTDENLGASYDQCKPADRVEDVEEANLIASRIIDSHTSVNHVPGPQHTIMLDIDVPARLVPSSTPGHSHLYIDVRMPWPRYLVLLECLADAGVIQRGYYNASRMRGFTALRLPWIKKVIKPKPKPKPEMVNSEEQIQLTKPEYIEPF